MLTGTDLFDLQNQPANDLELLLHEAKSDLERLPILTALGWVLAITDTDRAEALNDEARAINAKHADPHYQAHIVCNDARCLLYRNRYIQALKQLDEAQRLYDNAGDQSYRGGYLDLTRAIVFTYMSDKMAAQASAERVLTIAENTDNRHLMASALTIMGSLAGESGNLDMAQEWFLRCLSIYQAENDTRNIGKTYNNLSRIYIDQEEYETALEAAGVALNHYQQAGYRFGEMFPHNLMGEVYTKMGRFPEATQHYQVVLQIAEEFEHFGLMVVVHYQLAHIQQQSGHIDAAIEGYKTAILLCPPDLDTASLRDSHKYLAECYEQIGDHRQALDHLREYIRIHDKLTKAEIDKAFTQSQDRVSAAFARQEAAEANRRLEHADRLTAIGKMAAGIAHEITNPIQVVYMNLLLMQEEYDIPLLQSAIDQIEHITRLVNNMREMYQFEPRQESLLDCSVMVRNVLTLMQKTLDTAGITVEARLRDDLPTIKASATHIQQVVFNLVLNAHDAMPDGGTLTLSTEHDPQNNAVVLRVADTGVGIAAENIKHIFDPFFTTRISGSGLGLAICQNIVAHYDGIINVSSEVNRGTEFEVRFQAWRDNNS